MPAGGSEGSVDRLPVPRGWCSDGLRNLLTLKRSGGGVKASRAPMPVFSAKALHAG